MIFLSLLAVANLLATGALAWLVVRRTKSRTPITTVPTAKPTTATHQIKAFTLAGDPLPDLYLGDDDHEVKRKWIALKKRSNSGHWELWHARHGKRDSITRRGVL